MQMVADRIMEGLQENFEQNACLMKSLLSMDGIKQKSMRSVMSAFMDKYVERMSSAIKLNIAISIGKLPLYPTTVQYMSSTINGFGPVMLKLLQVVADDAEGNLKTVLANVKSSVAPMSSIDTYVMLKSAFPDIYSTKFVFNQISSSVTAGSLAQGHPAILSDGSRVVLKVLRRYIDILLEMDGDLLVEASKDMTNKNLELTFTEVIEDIQKETDFSVERKNMRKMLPVEKTLPAGITHVKERVDLPGPISLTAEKPVMILEHAPGIPLSSISVDDPRMTPIVACDLVRKLKAIYKANMQALIMTPSLKIGVAHADMQAGNLLVDLLPEQGTSHITVIDFVSIVELDYNEKQMLMSFGLALYYRHYDTLLDLLGHPKALQDPQKKKEMLSLIIKICNSEPTGIQNPSGSEKMAHVIDILSKVLVNRSDFEVKTVFRKVWGAHKLLVDLAVQFKAKFSDKLMNCPVKANQWLRDNMYAGINNMRSTLPMAAALFGKRLYKKARSAFENS